MQFLVCYINGVVFSVQYVVCNVHCVAFRVHCTVIIVQCEDHILSIWLEMEFTSDIFLKTSVGTD